MPELEIRSNSSAAVLRLSECEVSPRGPHDDLDFRAEVVDGSLHASAYVPDIYSTTWVEFFETLATMRTGWLGVRELASVEGHLGLRATCDRLGHVTFRVCLENQPLSGGWRVEVPLHVSLGQLDPLAKRARKFFYKAEHAT